MNTQEQPQQGKWYQSRMTWVLLGFIAIGGFFLVTEHTAHVLGALPFLLFLLCPLMMLFMMHGGHRGHGGKDEQPRREEGNEYEWPCSWTLAAGGREKEVR